MANKTPCKSRLYGSFFRLYYLQNRAKAIIKTHKSQTTTFKHALVKCDVADDVKCLPLVSRRDRSFKSECLLMTYPAQNRMTPRIKRGSL